ncbi:YhdP family protein [Thioalkalivibrio sp. XN279]|uniref:YhdP family protein n=1 Tax=Thioalkalivibrio sp. XN279 TaxID=2714953 RepID=UPI001408C9D2|nr:TIGR02099 family protein [Thioalkalivibrio sp. XN279]
MIRKLWRILGATVAVLVILAAVLLGVLRLLLVQVPEYRADVEARAEALLGFPVAIGAIDARLGFSGPEFRFERIRVLTRDGARTLFLAEHGAIQFDPWSLLRGRPSPELVGLTGVSLRVERAAEGRWQLYSEGEPLLPDSAGAEGRGPLPRLDHLPAGQLQLSEVTLEFEDLQRGTGPWTLFLEEFDLDLQPGRVALAASGRLPGELGNALDLSLAVTAQDERGWPRDWEGGVSATALDLAVLAAALGPDGEWPQAGIVDVSISAAVAGGVPERVAGDLRARQLQLPVAQSLAAGAPGVAAPAYGQLGSSFEWTRSPGGWTLVLGELEVGREGRRWRSPSATLALGNDGGIRRLLWSADRLQLEDLLPAARWLPEAWRDPVLALAPAGQLEGLEGRAAWPAGGGRLQELGVEARFAALEVAPFGRWPGVSNLSGMIAGDLDGGSGEISSQASRLELPQMFRAPLALDRLQAAFEWRREPGALLLRLPQLEAGNADAVVSGRALLKLPEGDASPELDMNAVARQVSMAAAPGYLPVGVMPERVVAWLDRALQGGRVPEARFELRGPTRAFPFRDETGVFRVDFDWEDGVLDFSPGWPAATALAAAVRFENEGLYAEVARGELAGVQAGPVEVAIPDLARGELRVQGRAAGSLAAMREFVLAADLLERTIGPGLAPAQIQGGSAEAQVDLELPLRALAQSRARVELDVRDGAIAYGFLGAPLEEINARLSIDNARVTAESVSATLAGAAVSAAVSVQPDGAVRVDGSGRMTDARLARVLRLPLERWLAGESPWQGHIVFPAPGTDEPLRMEVVSGLEGMVVGLPQPFRKASAGQRRLRVQAEFADPAYYDAVLEWDEALRAKVRVERTGPEPRLGVVPGGVDNTVPGVVLSGAVAELDLGGWFGLDWPEQVDGDGLGQAIAGGRLLIGRLVTPWAEFEDLLLEATHEESHWRLAVDAERAAGQLRFPHALYGDDPVIVRLDRLWLASPAREEATSGSKDTTPEGIAPSLVPGLDLQVDDLRWGNIRAGSVSGLVLHEGDGFELVGLEGMGDGFLLKAQGRSRLSDAVDASSLALELESEDVGQALEFLGFKRSMDARSGRFEASVEWQGGLRRDWLGAIEGTARIDIRDGALVGVEPGAGRVFGLLSIQALPRRLALDFKDVFGAGTAFDRITGDFSIEGGDAYTENLVMRGPAADMGVVGRTGLVARDYDQTAVIAADLGRTLPVAGTVVGGPVVGAALFILSEMLRKPFEAQLTYRITGPWEDPVIERLGAAQAPSGPRDAAPEAPREEPR